MGGGEGGREGGGASSQVAVLYASSNRSSNLFPLLGVVLDVSCSSPVAYE